MVALTPLLRSPVRELQPKEHCVCGETRSEHRVDPIVERVEAICRKRTATDMVESVTAVKENNAYQGMQRWSIDSSKCKVTCIYREMTRLMPVRYHVGVLAVIATGGFSCATCQPEAVSLVKVAIPRSVPLFVQK